MPKRTNNLAAVIGTWPGDETDQELLGQLDEYRKGERMPKLTFLIHMQAQPQGSIRAFQPAGGGRPSLTSDNAKMKPFRGMVAMACRMAMRDAGMTEPWIGEHIAVAMDVTFYLKRPKSVKRPFPTTKPDLDKLTRCIGDALTGFAYADDAQVIAGKQLKLYGPEPLVSVTIRPYQP